jgi:hypothetical protein
VRLIKLLTYQRLKISRTRRHRQPSPPSLKSRVHRASGRLTHTAIAGMLIAAAATLPAQHGLPIAAMGPVAEIPVRSGASREVATATKPAANISIVAAPPLRTNAADAIVAPVTRTPPVVRAYDQQTASLTPQELPVAKHLWLRGLTQFAKGPAGGTVASQATEVALGAAPAPADDRPIGIARKSQPFTVLPMWSEAQIAEARSVCAKLLDGSGIIVTDADPIRQGSCGTPAPVRVSRLGVPAVSIQPSATLTCPMAAALNTWISKTVQPAAQAAFGVPVVRLVSASSYACRNRYGRNDAPLSEHALVNALDLSGFVLADGRTIRVLDGWGPTARDNPTPDQTDAPVAVALASSKVLQAPGLSKLGGPVPAAAKVADQVRSEKTVPDRATTKADAGPVEVPKAAGGDATARGSVKKLTAKALARREHADKQARFLRDVHRGACDTFGTALGPEANDAHRDHFHFDMKERRRRSYCQ